MLNQAQKVAGMFMPGDAKLDTLASVVLEVAWKPVRTMTSMLGAC